MSNVKINQNIPSNSHGQNIPESAKRAALNNPIIKKAIQGVEKNLEKKHKPTSPVTIDTKTNSQGKTELIDVKSSDKRAQEQIKEDIKKELRK